MDLPPYITRDVGIDGAPGYDLPELIKLLSDFSSWLERIGINTSNTRLVRYIAFLENWLKRPFSWPEIEPDDEELIPLPDEIVKLLYTMKEVHEFIWIYKCFKDKLPPGSEALLRIMIGGQDLARDDVDTRARNHQFQLRIASYFVSGNHEVDLSGKADVLARLSRDHFFIECKRLYSNKKVNARIKEAAAQLSKRSRNQKLFTKNCCIAAFENIAFPQEGSIWGWDYKHCRDALQKG